MVVAVPPSLFAPELAPSANHTLTIRTVNYEIVHQVAGRLRVHVPRLSHDEKFAQRLVDSVSALPGVKKARASRDTSSLVVLYHETPGSNARKRRGGSDSDSVVTAVIGCIRTAAKADVARNMASERNAAQAAEATQAPHTLPARNINYVKQLGVPALGLGLSAALTAGLAVPASLVGATVAAATIPHALRALQGLRTEKRLTVEILDVAAVGLLLSQSSFLAPAFMMAVIEGAEVVRSWTARRARRAGLDLLLTQRRHVLVERDGEQERVELAVLVPGDIVLVNGGDQIPVDGEVLDGKALIDQHRVTGDAAPVTARRGDSVHATAVVIEGHLRIQAIRTGVHTQAASAISSIAAAPKPDTRSSNWARKTGNWGVAPTLLIAGAVWATSNSTGRAAGIVALDFGLGMRVSAPVAILTAQTSAARNGILIRSGRAVEMLGQFDTIVFDKTATLTGPVGKVVAVQSLLPDVSPEQLLALAASVERPLDHPIAESIVHEALEQEMALQPCTEWTYRGAHGGSGQGVIAQVAGQVIHVGSARLMEEIGLRAAVLDRPIPGVQEPATRVYVALNGQLAGAILCANPLRPESTEVIARLRQMNKTVVIASGDSTSVVQTIAAQLGLDPADVYGDLLPQQKADLVSALQAGGKKVALVGDGVNDVAAMARADVAISPASAGALARETADVVLLNDNLADLLHGMLIGRHALRIIEQNQAIVVCTNTAGIAYGALAVLNPIAGVAINNGVALATALNSLRPINTSEQDESR